MAAGMLKKLIFALVAALAWTFASAFLPTAAYSLTDSASSSVGAIVDVTPTTAPPPPVETAAPVTTPTPPATDSPERVVPADTTEKTETTPTTELPPVDIAVPPAPEDKGVAAAVISAVKSTKQIVKSILGGKAVADAVGENLPAPVASVVVPAVRTASTFAFPIGLAGAVFAFLLLQQRIDSSDPKLTAAPLAHDDDVIEFR